MRNAEEIVILPEMREKILNELRQVLRNVTLKISELFDNSSLSKFVTRSWIEVNDLSRSGDYVNKNKI